MLGILPLLGLAILLVPTDSQITTTPTPNTWRWSRVPNPRKNPSACNRGQYASWVCDPNKIITRRQADAIDRLINSTVRDTVCPCREREKCHRDDRGYLIAVALLNRFTSRYEGSDPYRWLQEARRFAYGLYSRKWKFARCNELVLIVYSRDQELAYTLTGPKARAQLTNELVLEIATEANVYFTDSERRNVTQGLLQMIDDYKRVFLHTYRRRNFARFSAYKSDEKDDMTVKDNAQGNAYSLPILLSSLVAVAMATVFFR